MYHMDYQVNGLCTAQLSMKTPFFMRRPTVEPTVISIMSTDTHERARTENFIKRIYSRAYNASIEVHYPILLSVRDRQDNILAALGFRYAMHENLFLEQYLQKPVEQILDVPRNEITEIGNLASVGGGASIFLFAAVTAYLNSINQNYAVITGTRMIHHRLKMLGIRPRILAQADPGLLVKSHEDWGTYYSTQPHVLTGRLDQAYKRLQFILNAQYTETLSSLQANLHYRGDMS